MHKHMNKYILGLSLFIIALITGCSKEQRLSPNDVVPNGTEVALEVSFPGRTLARGGALRSGGTVPAQGYEQALQPGTILFYVFEDNGSGQPGKLKRIEPVTDLSDGVPEKGVTGKVFFRDHGKLHVVPTANLKLTKPERDKLLGSSFEDVSKTLITQPAGEPNWFPMAGEPVVVETASLSSTSEALRFNLERLSVRIDLVNETSTELGGRFELTGARLREGNIDRSFLMKGQTPALKVGEHGATALPAHKWIERDEQKNSDPNQMLMQLYTYENEPGELWIEVKGTFEGQPAEFRLPFRPAPKRNTLYRVAIRNTKTTDVPIEDPTAPKVEPGITVQDWIEGGVASIEPTQDRTQPVITTFEASDDRGTPTTAKHDATFGTEGDVNTMQTLTLSTPDRYTMKLTLKSKGTEPMVLVQKAEVPWIKVEPIGRPEISTDGRSQDFLVTFAKNADLFPRTALLEIQNRFYPDKVNPRQIKVEQPKAVTTMNQLAYWAKANVNNLNTFAAEVTEHNVYSMEAAGKLYQWGRNIPFSPFSESDKSLSVKIEKIDGNSADLWNPSVIIGSSNGYASMYSFDTKGLSWSQVVNKATNAPQSYKGTNGGDPSPVGYRLPTVAEARAIIADKRFISSFETVQQKSINQTGVAIRTGSTVEYLDFTSTYLCRADNVVYSLSLVDNSNKYTTAYRYEYRGNLGIKITSRHLGTSANSVDLNTIASPNFWETNAGSDVVRYLPTIGGHLLFNGKRGPSDISSFYWLDDGVEIAVNKTHISIADRRPSCSLGFFLRPVLK